jgi:hypothetical protein
MSERIVNSLIFLSVSLLGTLLESSSTQVSPHMSARETSMPDHYHTSLQQEWKHYFNHLCALSISQQPLCDLLGPPFLNHAYELSPTQLRRSLAFVGPNHRLRRVTQDLISGSRKVHVGVIGTSISWGTGMIKVVCRSAGCA